MFLNGNGLDFFMADSWDYRVLVDALTPIFQGTAPISGIPREVLFQPLALVLLGASLGSIIALPYAIIKRPRVVRAGRNPWEWRATRKPMHYVQDLSHMKTCGVCSVRFGPGTYPSSMRRCRTCGIVFCEDHIQLRRGTSQQVSEHELSFSDDQEACPNGHPTIEYAFSVLNLKSLDLCQFSSRHGTSEACWDVVPCCKAQHDKQVNQHDFGAYCQGDYGECPHFIATTKRWWKVWS